MSPGDPSENNKKSHFHCTVIIIAAAFMYISYKYIILVLLLNLYSAHYMLTHRGALYYKVKISQWAAK